MTALDKIAYLQGRKDQFPNQELARELVESNDKEGIKEIADNLLNENKNIQGDCIKVLYEAGYLKPEIIAEYVDDFIKLLGSKNNRLVWGGMTALTTIANIKADEIYADIETIYQAIEKGSVITIDSGVKVLAGVASQNDVYSENIFPFLLDHLKKCRPKEVAQHAESTFEAVNSKNQNEFIKVLKEREAALTNSQLARIEKLYKKLNVI